MLTSFSSLAQFSDSVAYYINATSTGSINKADGNSAYLLNNSARLNVRKKSVSLNFGNSWLYGRQNEGITNNDFSTSLDFNLYKTLPHFFYWGLANYNTSYSLRINNQLLAGGGVAYNVYDRENAHLNLSNGLLFDASDIVTIDDSREVYETLRNSFRIVFRFTINELITLSGTNFIQNSLKNSDDYNIRLSDNISFKLLRGLNLTANFTYNRINRTKSENMLLSYGLAYERYF